MSDLAAWLTANWPAALTGAGPMAALAAWLQWRASRREDRKLEAAATDDVIEALREAMAEQRTELDRLRARVDSAEAKEVACQARVMQLREAVHALRNAMMRSGLVVPDLPMLPAE